MMKANYDRSATCLWINLTLFEYNFLPIEKNNLFIFIFNCTITLFSVLHHNLFFVKCLNTWFLHKVPTKRDVQHLSNPPREVESLSLEQDLQALAKQHHDRPDPGVALAPLGRQIGLDGL